MIKKQYIGYPRIYDKVCEYKGNLYWANFREYSENENGERIYARKNIIRANLQEIIDFTGNIFPIEYLCDEFNGERVVSLYIENGVLYFLTFNRDWWKENDEKSYLIAWDLDLNKKIWVNEISKEMFLSEGDFKIAEGKIYLIGNYGRYCYDMITGKKEWSRVQNDEDRFKEIIIHTADLSKDMLFYDEKIYFTNEESFMSGKASGHPKENYKNILCISAKDGSYVWGDMIHFGISNFIVPCEYNNKIYFSTEKGLRVYEAQKGKLIGVDKEYNCSGQDPMYKYNDILLFFVNQYDHIDLVAMKAE
ncbi:MAG: PQQ-like beta-propeller repeat protein [Treponema sp.]|nr:PQQ-like beta-propeller repeat protein [Treponema sp.]